MLRGYGLNIWVDGNLKSGRYLHSTFSLLYTISENRVNMDLILYFKENYLCLVQ